MPTSLIEMIESYHEKQKQHRFFDSNCWIAFHQQQLLYPIENMKNTIHALQSVYIGEAVVTNAQSIEYNPHVGNERLIPYIADYPNLFGCSVWSPELAVTRAEIQSYLDKMIRNKVVGFRMFPKNCVIA